MIKESDKGSVNNSNKNSLERLEEMFEEIDKESEEEFIEDLKEAIGLNNKSTTNWYDKIKFNKILNTIDSNNFNHKNKIDKFKFNDINDLINNIKNNTISEADTKKKINELNEIKKVEIKGKRLIESQKKLLSLFDDLLKTIFNETVNESKSDNESDYESDNESDNEGEKDKYYYEIRQLNNWFETIDQTKSLEEQIELLKEKGEFLSEYWNVGYYHGNKELNYKIFKAKTAYLLNELDK